MLSICPISHEPIKVLAYLIDEKSLTAEEYKRPQHAFDLNSIAQWVLSAYCLNNKQNRHPTMGRKLISPLIYCENNLLLKLLEKEHLSYYLSLLRPIEKLIRKIKAKEIEVSSDPNLLKNIKIILKICTKICPNDPCAYFHLGQVNAIEGNDESALDYLSCADEKMKSFSNPSIKPLVSMALICRRRGDLEKAMVCLERAVQRDPTDWKLWFNVSLLHYQAKDFKQASSAFTRANTLFSKGSHTSSNESAALSKLQAAVMSLQ